MPGEAELRQLHARLEAQRVAHKLIIENDNGYAGQATAIGVVPKPRSQLRRFFSSLRLLS